MAKKDLATSEIWEVLDSGRDNHYVMKMRDSYFGEVSGETVRILDFDACSLYGRETIVSLCKETPEHIKAVYNSMVERRREMMNEAKQIKDENEQIKKEVEARKIGEDYKKTHTVSIDLGFQKALAVMQFMASKDSPPLNTYFNALDSNRISKYNLKRYA